MQSATTQTENRGSALSRVVLPEAQRYRRLLEAEEQAELVAQNDALRYNLSAHGKSELASQHSTAASDVEDEAAVASGGATRSAASRKLEQVRASLSRAEERQRRVDEAAATASKRTLTLDDTTAVGSEWLRVSVSGGNRNQQQQLTPPPLAGYISPARNGNRSLVSADRWSQGTRGLNISSNCPSLKTLLAEQANVMRPSTAPVPIPASAMAPTRSLSPLTHPEEAHRAQQGALRIKSVDAGREVFAKEKDAQIKAILAKHDATRTSVTEKYRVAAEQRRLQREREDADIIGQSVGAAALSEFGAGGNSSMCGTYMKKKADGADSWGRPAGLTAQDDILALEHQKEERRQLRKKAKRAKSGDLKSNGAANQDAERVDEVSSTSSEEDESGHRRTYAEKCAEREAERLLRLKAVTQHCNDASGGKVETRREYFDVGQRIRQAKDDAARARRANIAVDALASKRSKDPISAGTSLREMLGLAATSSVGAVSLRESSPSKSSPLNVVTATHRRDTVAVDDANADTTVSIVSLEYDDDDENPNIVGVREEDLRLRETDGGVVSTDVAWDDDADVLYQRPSSSLPPSSATNRAVELRLESFGVKGSAGVVSTIFGFSPPSSRQQHRRLVGQIEQNRAQTAPLSDYQPARNAASSSMAVRQLDLGRGGATTPSTAQKKQVAWYDEGHQHRFQNTTITTNHPSAAPFSAKLKLAPKPSPDTTDPSYPSGTNGGFVPATAATFGTLRPPSSREELERARTPAIYIPVVSAAAASTSANPDLLRDPDSGRLVDTSELDLTPVELRDKRRHDAQDASRMLSASAAEALRSSRRRMEGIEREAEGGRGLVGYVSPSRNVTEGSNDYEMPLGVEGGEADGYEGLSPSALAGDVDDDDVFPRPHTAHRKDHDDICGITNGEPATPGSMSLVADSPTFLTHRQKTRLSGGGVTSSVGTTPPTSQIEIPHATTDDQSSSRHGTSNLPPIIETSVDSAINNKKHALRPLDEMQLELEVAAMEDELRRRQSDKKRLIHSRESVSSARKERLDAAAQNVQDLRDGASLVDSDIASEKQANTDQFKGAKHKVANSWRQPFVPKHQSEWEVEAAAIKRKQDEGTASSGGAGIRSPTIPGGEDEEARLSTIIATDAEIAAMDADTREGYALMRSAALQRMEATTEPALRAAIANSENSVFLVLWELWHGCICGEEARRIAYEREEASYRRSISSHSHSSLSKAEDMTQMPEVLRDLLAPPASSLGGFHATPKKRHSLTPVTAAASSNNSFPAGRSQNTSSSHGGDDVDGPPAAATRQQMVVEPIIPTTPPRRLSESLAKFDGAAGGGAPPTGGYQESPKRNPTAPLPPLSPSKRAVSSPGFKSVGGRAVSPGGSTTSTTGTHGETIQLVEECNQLREELLGYSRDKLRWKNEKRKLRQEYLTACIERGIRPFADVYVDESGTAHFTPDVGGSGSIDGLALTTVETEGDLSEMMSSSNKSGMRVSGSANGIRHTIGTPKRTARVTSGSPTTNALSESAEFSRPPSRAITDMDDDVAAHMQTSRPGTSAANHDHPVRLGGDSVTEHSNLDASDGAPSTVAARPALSKHDPILVLRRRLEVVQWSVDDTEQREQIAKKRLAELSSHLADSR